MTLVEHIVALIRRTSTELPGDVVEALARHRDGGIVETMLRNVEVAKEDCVPLCQDTGTLTFWFEVPDGTPQEPLIVATREAVKIATEQGWLRQNTIVEPNGVAQEDNVSETHPIIHFKGAEESRWTLDVGRWMFDVPIALRNAQCRNKNQDEIDVDCSALCGQGGGGNIQHPTSNIQHRKEALPSSVRVRLLMKGGGSENVGRQYSLPDAELGAGRDLDGVRRCVLDAVYRAQGNGCAPGILGVCIGGDCATGFEVAKAQLLRSLDDHAENAEIAALEARLLDEINTLGIGPMGMGGTPTALGVKIGTASRVPASYFVTVAYMCWCCRRGETTLTSSFVSRHSSIETVARTTRDE